MPALHRLPLLVLGMVALVYGVSVGLVRLGWALPVPHPSHLEVHGPAMVAGFLGTVIALERAVAIGRAWGYGAPATAALFTLSVLLIPGYVPARLLVPLAGVWLLALYGAALARQRSLAVATMAAGAALWMVGGALWAAGWPLARVAWWWVGFPVLTVAGERLELTRFLRPTAARQAAFVAAAGALGASLFASLAWPGPGRRLTGLALVALAAWMLRNDVAWRTIRQPGLPRFIAVCLLSGYAWLAVGGGLAAAAAGEWRGPLYDAALHAVFLGFTFAMIFGHAPVIFPAIVGGVIPFRPRFYVHLALLHASLLWRVAADLESAWGPGGWARGRPLGGLLNAAALLVFVANTASSFRRTPAARAHG